MKQNNQRSLLVLSLLLALMMTMMALVITVTATPSSPTTIAINNNNNNNNNLNDAQELALGESKFDDLALNQPKFFSLAQLAHPLEATDDELIISLTSISGDADVYLSVSNTSPGPETGYDLSSTSRGEDLIVINSSMIGYDAKMKTGPYYIGVHASRHNAHFSIVAYQNNKHSHVVMRDGYPQTAQAGWKQYTYFRYESSGEKFVISVTSIYGDPDLYVSDVAEFPSVSNYTLKKNDRGNDVLEVPATGAPTTFYIAVYSFSASSYYNLMVQSQNSSGLLLASVPLFAKLASRTTQYYRFKLTYETDFKIKVDKKSWSGDPSVFVSTVHERPTSDNCEWKGESAYRAEEVIISKTDANYTSNGYYYIAVFDDSLFTVDVTIIVELSDASEVISSGIPVSGSIPNGKVLHFKAYYSLKPGDHAQYIEITGTPHTVSGSLQLYASSRDEFPDASNAEFTGANMLGSNVIHVADPKVGWLYISMLGKADSTFTLTVSQAKQFVLLEPSIPVSYNVLTGQYRDFVIKADAQNEHDVVLSVHSYSGDADFYVGTTSNVSRHNYIWSSALASSDVITISKNDPERRSPDFTGHFYIAVYGFRDSYFSITGFYGNTTVEIFDGTSLTGTVNRGNYAYYKYYLTNPASLSMNLRALYERSDPDLYVSMETVYPNKDNYSWRSIRFGDDFLNIPFAGQGWYYIGVYGYRDNTTFILSVSAGAEILSSFGYSLVDYVVKGQYRYYTSYIYPDVANPVVTGVTLIAGDTELYANHNETYPSTTQHHYSDKGWPGNFISVKSDATTSGIWTFAVYGVENSYYYIHASTRDTQGSLRLAEPKIGVVKRGESATFKYNFYDTVGTYAVYLNQIASIPSRAAVYIDEYPNIAPNATSHKWSAEGTDDLLVQLNDASENAAFYMTVVSLDIDMRFQISIIDNNEPIFLTEEQPNKVATKQGQRHYFAIPSIPILPGTNDSQLHAVLASCDDVVAPVMYGSIRERKPDKDHSEFKSTADGKFRQKMLSPVEKVTNTLYYIGSEASAANGIFSIYATTFGDSRPTITGEMVVQGLVTSNRQRIKIPRASSNQGPIRYFLYKRVLTAQEDSTKINMHTVCAVQNGKAELVTELPTDTTDDKNLYYDLEVDSQKRYVVNVVVVDAYGLAASYNALAFNTGDTNVLELGKALRGNVAEKAYARYKIESANIPDKGYLSVALTPFSGDVDLYVDTKENFDKSNARWKGEQGGFDIITIQKSELPTATNLYVAVYGASGNALFSVMAHMSGMTQELQDGLPQIGDVAQFKYNYFKFSLDDNSTFTVTLTPIDGDPDVVVATNTHTPTRDTAQWYSAGGSIDLVTIANTDPDFREGADYYIGVYGWSAAKYEITVTKQNSIAQITEGVPHGGRAERFKYEYFKFTLSAPRGVFITVTTLLDGADPDIYVSTVHERPSISQYEWKRDQTGGVDTIYIPKTDPAWKEGTYYIAVRAWRVDATFQVIARSEDSSLLLTDGTSQTLTSVVGGYTTFKFFYGYNKNSLTFSVTGPTSGAVELYGSKSYTKPTREKHEYTAVVQGTKQTITIDQGSSIQWYFVSVYGVASCNYTISASTNQRPIVLSDGEMSVNNYVETNTYAYFTFDFDPSARRDITISTLVEFGDPDLYVATNVTRPTKESHTWKKRDARSDTLIIKAEELPASATRLYIGAFGYIASRFSIVAFSSNQTVELMDASPIIGFVAKDEYKQYTYEMTNKGRLKFTLNINSGSDADLYVSRKPNPSEANYDYKGDNFGSDIVEFEGEARWYYISVRGPRYGDGVSYTLQANTLYETLEVGGYVRDNGRNDKPRHYKVTINSLAERVLTSVTLINGRTELYINTNGSEPATREKHTFSSRDFPGNVLFVHKSDAKFVPGVWSVAVYSVQESDYFVSVQTQEGKLYSGIPRIGYVDPSYEQRSAVVYQYRVGWGVPKLTINVRPFGDISDGSCVVLYGSQTTSKPSPTDHKWTARSNPAFGYQLMMVISSNLNEGRNLYLSVQSCDGRPIKYEISVNSEDGVAYLTQNYPSLFTPNNAEYTVLTPRLSNTLFIKVDSCNSVSIENLQLSASKKRNNTVNPEYIGSIEEGNPFTTLIDAKAIDHANSGLLYVHLKELRAPLPLFMSIFTTTSARDLRPVTGIIESKFIGYTTVDKVKKVQFDLTMDQMTNQQVARVFMIEADKNLWDKKNPDAILTKYNMFTTCGIRMNKDVVVAGKTLEKQKTVRVTVDLDKVYILNAIVYDSVTQLEWAYTPVAINKGYIVSRSLKFSVGALFIFLGMTALVAYLIIGVSINLIRGEQTGANVIPQYYLWSEVPGLIVDGVKFIVFCGRSSSTNYAVFEDEGYGESEADVNPFTISNTSRPKAEPQQQSTGESGYGAI